jgi:hypothetical protein
MVAWAGKRKGSMVFKVEVERVKPEIFIAISVFTIYRYLCET